MKISAPITGLFTLIAAHILLINYLQLSAATAFAITGFYFWAYLNHRKKKAYQRQIIQLQKQLDEFQAVTDHAWFVNEPADSSKS